MAITKSEIITKLDAYITTMTSELNTIMASGNITTVTEEMEMMRCVAGLQRCENAKTWVEANL
jgi:hypothetical protein|tara:strand:- start:1439 stop:1627 length:189 start_codon:yes stop_codon:yes gene_type:complete